MNRGTATRQTGLEAVGPKGPTTISDVAAWAGVSKTTVSHVLPAGGPSPMPRAARWHVRSRRWGSSRASSLSVSPVAAARPSHLSSRT
ncbi:LacI family DNA-binding transcriptional regulator [Streptomyces sp. NPDC051662]|uniref:LacI family DNA-binding transcriptional regulator n=1 Tax=Streptomyces sp. NPDC051662 TaxID=3154750 RepID=UPI00342D8179